MEHQTRTRLPGERIFTPVLLVASCFMLWQAFRISKFESITSAGFFPMLAALTMVISVVVVAVRDRHAPIEAAAPGESGWRHFVRRLLPLEVVSFTAAIAAYMLLLEPLGFVLASYLFLVVSMALLGSRRPVLNLVVSAVSLAAIYAVFQTVFSVVLPKGRWIAPLVEGWFK
ncbi:MAG: tripartite tricarboxylate transporter TctB family protein [Rubrivivax sp.]|nr:tripartite tricarboxylate transporter TctB family protein [Rubrivivax sp.]